MERLEEHFELDAAGDLDEELAQLTQVETLVANIYASSCPTNATVKCSGKVCCM